MWWQGSRDVVNVPMMWFLVPLYQSILNHDQSAPQVTVCTEKEMLITMNDDQQLKASPQTQIPSE